MEPRPGVYKRMGKFYRITKDGQVLCYGADPSLETPFISAHTLHNFCGKGTELIKLLCEPWMEIDDEF